MISTLVAADAASGNLFQRIIDWSIPIGSTNCVLSGRRRPHRRRVRVVRHEALGLGLADRHQRQHHPVLRLPGRPLRCRPTHPALRAGRAPGLFILTSIYGWWRWNQHRARRAAPTPPRRPSRRGGPPPRSARRDGALWLLGTVVVHQVFVALWNAPNPYWQPQWWFYWCDAWIFVGSIIATYAMARGWNEFWLAWIGVDLIGVPLGFATGYVPTAVMYIFYGMFVLYGFTQWVRSRAASPLDAPARETSSPRKVGA